MSAFLLVGLFGLAFAGRAEVARFEKAAAQDILAKLSGPEARVEVKSNVGPEALFGEVHSVRIRAANFFAEGLPLFTESRRSKRGFVRRLEIDLQDFTLRGLRIDRLHSTIPNCHFDLPLAVRQRRIRLSQSGEGVGTVQISQEHLGAFIRRKFAEIKQATVRIDRDKVFVDGYGEFLIFKTNFSLVARLEPVGGTRLNLAHARMLFDGRVPDPESQRLLLDTLNPVVDLNKDLKLHGAITLERVVLRDGVLTAEGRTRIPELPQSP